MKTWFPLVIIIALFAPACGGQDRDIDDGGVPPGDQCRNHEHCEDDELCNDDRCEAAYDRPYRIGITNVSLSRSHSPNGDDWDDDGTPPDPIVCITIGNTGDEAEHCTSVEVDTYSPVFDRFTIEVILTVGQRMQVELCDDDEGTPQCWMIDDMSEVSLTVLRTGSISLIPDDPTRLDDWAVTLSFDPI